MASAGGVPSVCERSASRSLGGLIQGHGQGQGHLQGQGQPGYDGWVESGSRDVRSGLESGFDLGSRPVVITQL